MIVETVITRFYINIVIHKVKFLQRKENILKIISFFNHYFNHY